MSAPAALAWRAAPSTPRAHLEVAIARRLFERAVRMLPVQARYPDGRVVRAHPTSADAPVFELVRPAAFFARMGRDTKIGFGEAYMAGDWRPGAGTDLADLLTPFAARLTTLIPQPLQRLRAIVDDRIPSHHENTLAGARDNISAHYDLSNELFEAFLDPTLTYSSAWFAGDPRLADWSALEAAQHRKIDGILDYAQVGRGSRVLEIGTGWGALAIRAAQRGAHVTSVTISAEQLALAQQRVNLAGVSEQVDLRLQDYREVTGQFDAIVSVEMIEAVGEAYWPTYFATMDRLLAPGGRIAIQAITMSHERMRLTRHSYGWIQKYIFPGGLIPSLQAIDETCAAHTGLAVTGRRDLGRHYARTLGLWRERFDSAWHTVHQLGFDDTFRRMWEFYLAYCEAGFRVGYLGVSQLQLAKTDSRT
ncbi:MAG TPA: cyclopropane-fatty-acyl-phospholipid synthase family protein [Dermatophilaceae bacterium]|nr:cyclopropane-fatty-acyl-phospholipid synthase family protein [Dermatophilaceae bacterium]